MIVRTTLAIISSIAITILIKRLKSFCDDNNISYEIKTDIRAATTNNIFVEFIQNGKLSGIATTEADNYIIVIPYDKLPLFI